MKQDFTGPVEKRASVFLDSILERSRSPVILGIAGSQGSGKSTLARKLAARVNAGGRRAATLSLDDFYLGRAVRRRLASEVHPLFVTRGPPGTHDVAAAADLIDAVRRGEETSAPAFDKSLDDRTAQAQRIPAALDVLIFEGWCLGASAEDAQSLHTPINMLERIFDADGGWRRAVNAALGSSYQALFRRLDKLVYLRAPDFSVVAKWRAEQENAMRSTLDEDCSHRVMRDDEIAFFIQHYERITRRMMMESPHSADMTLQLDESRNLIVNPAA